MRYAKFLVAIVGAGITAALQLGLTGTLQQVLTVFAAVVTAIGVFGVPNQPAGAASGNGSVR